MSEGMSECEIVRERERMRNASDKAEKEEVHYLSELDTERKENKQCLR